MTSFIYMCLYFLNAIYLRNINNILTLRSPRLVYIENIVFLDFIHLKFNFCLKGVSMEQNFEQFCEFVRELLKNKEYSLDIEPGRKYVKLVSRSGNSRSVWCFVDKETGDILKAATWKQPAKHARGNVKDPSSYQMYEWTGPYYLKRA